MVCLVLCATVLLPACGGDSSNGGEAGDAPQTADAAMLEDEIANDLEASVGIAPASVECPDDIPLEADEPFECITAPNGDEVIFAGRLTDDQGSFDGEVLPEGQGGQSAP